MRKFLVLFPVLFLALWLTGTTAPPTAVAQDGPNLLRNPGFEGDYFAWSGIPEVQVAHEWTPWWINDPSRDPRWHRPEWKRALSANFPDRVLSGSSAQQYFTFYASHYAGMYQQVFNVTPGKRYRFGLWVQLWSSLEDNADVSVMPANPRLQIGIEPNGVALPGFAQPPGTVIWSGQAPMDQIVDRWGYMTVETTAKNDVITVYIRSSPDFANKHNDIYLDEASLVEVGAPAQPAPTATPATETETQSPTAVPTLAPTATVALETEATTEPTTEPTATNEPTATATATITATTEPSPTPTAEPTATATATSEPTATATATSEPTATATTEPSPTATATAEATSTTSAAPEATTEAATEATEVAQANVPTLPTETATSTPPPANPSQNNPASGGLSPLLLGLLIGSGLTLLGVAVFVWMRRR